jgi:mRNA interferase RelE/StbE
VARYSLLVKPSAAKEIEAIEPKAFRRKVVERIQELAENPRPPGCEKLSGQPDRYRVRQGPWRVVYAVKDEELVVFVVKVGHRREVYRVT